jgi:hypothetical protein
LARSLQKQRAGNSACHFDRRVLATDFAWNKLAELQFYAKSLLLPDLLSAENDPTCASGKRGKGGATIS